MKLMAVFIVGACLASTPALAQFEGRCEPGEAANERDGWEWIENNARRKADEHAMDHNPAATYVMARVTANFQFAGEYEGKYLVMVQTESPPISFAVLQPNFDFCSDPAELDDERDDLFEVVSAKLDGREYF